MANDKLKYAQNIYTFCVEKYGTIQEIARLVIENNLKYDELIDQGKELIFDENIGNEDVKDFMIVNKQVPTNLVDNPFIFASFEYEDGENYIFEDSENYIFENQQ